MNLYTAIIHILLLFTTQNEVHSGLVQFVRQPSSQNVSLGSEATFNCTAHSTYFYWLVNGVAVNHDNNANRGLVEVNQVIDAHTSLKQHLLRVPAKELNNGISIQCNIWEIGNSEDGDQVFLQIQGLLSPVTDLQAVWLNSTSILVSYTPPYTLDGVPITNYTIELVTTAPMNSTQKFNTTKTLYIFYNEVSWCFHHSVTVSVWNDVGEGNTTLLKLDQIEIPNEPWNITATITLKESIILTATANISYPWVPDTIGVVILSATGNTETMPESTVVTTNCAVETLHCDNEEFQLSSSSAGEDFINVLINITSYVQTGYQYNVTVSISNCVGTTNSTGYSIRFDDAIDNSMSSSHAAAALVSSSSPFFVAVSSNTIEPSSAPYSTHVSKLTSVTVSSSTIADTSSTDSSQLTMSLPWILLVVILLLFIGIISVLLFGFLVHKKRKVNKVMIKSDATAGEKEIAFVIESQRKFTIVSKDTTGEDSQQKEDQVYYETINSVQQEVLGHSQQQQMFETADCPAYGTLALKQEKTSVSSMESDYI